MSTATTSTAAILDQERARKRESSAGGYAPRLPTAPARTEGVTVHGADGRAYLDDCWSASGAPDQGALEGRIGRG